MEGLIMAKIYSKATELIGHTPLLGLSEPTTNAALRMNRLSHMVIIRYFLMINFMAQLFPMHPM